MTILSYMATDWYVAVDGSQRGPLSTGELVRWIREGKVRRDTLAKQGADGRWVHLSELSVGNPTHGGQWLLNLAGLAAIVALGIELFLFLLAKSSTAGMAPVALLLYVSFAAFCWPRWAGKRGSKA
jgi:hypothetical protein